MKDMYDLYKIASKQKTSKNAATLLVFGFREYTQANNNRSTRHGKFKFLNQNDYFNSLYSNNVIYEVAKKIEKSEFMLDQQDNFYENESATAQQKAMAKNRNKKKRLLKQKKIHQKEKNNEKEVLQSEDILYVMNKLLIND
jgi:hypothetical protein